MKEVVVQIKVDERVEVSDTNPFALPAYETDHASGMDVRFNPDGMTSDELKSKLTDGFATVDKNGNIERVILHPGCRALLPTGIRVAIPIGYEIQVRPRSGLALKRGLTVLNTPGTIDADYRGEIGVIVFNSNRESVTIESYERIAQLVLTPVVRCKWELVDELPVTNRGDGGFNSTGTK